MAIDQGTAESTGSKESAPVGQARMSRSAFWACVAVTAVLVAWFFFAWLALDRHVVDAAGESVGSAFALLLVVSIVGAIRGRGRH